MATSGDSVGYGRPPKEHRFKKGQSGNPSGRPKAKPNLREDIEHELSELIAVEDGATGTTVTKSRAVAKALIAAALKGDVRAANMILCFMDRATERDVDAPTSTEEDKDVLDEYIERKARR